VYRVGGVESDFLLTHQFGRPLEDQALYVQSTDYGELRKGEPSTQAISLFRAGPGSSLEAAVSSSKVPFNRSDGKTMTITTTGTDEKGVAFNDTPVFHKRKANLSG
jgi:hypothetical protein